MAYLGRGAFAGGGLGIDPLRHRPRAARGPLCRCWERPCTAGRRRRRVLPPLPCWLLLHPPAAAAGGAVLPFCACSGTVPRAACAGSSFPCHRKGALTCEGRPVSSLPGGVAMTGAALPSYPAVESSPGAAALGWLHPLAHDRRPHLCRHIFELSDFPGYTAGAPHWLQWGKQCFTALALRSFRGCMQCPSPLLPCLKTPTPTHTHEHPETCLKSWKEVLQLHM